MPPQQAARRFFAFPVETKRRAAVNQRHRGFNALGDATMYQAKRPDYKEFFSIGLELPEDDPDVLAGQALRGPNNWPDFMPELRPALYGYYEAVGECGADLLRAVAVSLGVDEHFFAPRYTKRMQRTQMVYYPPQPPQSDEDQFGVAPHTDYGCITLLWQDQVGGLQVREIANDTWVDAPPIEGSFVVNVGDLLARWTNDRFRSTLHRVINASGRERYSIATFYDPTYGATVDPRELGTSDAEVQVSAGRRGRLYPRAYQRFDGLSQETALKARKEPLHDRRQHGESSAPHRSAHSTRCAPRWGTTRCASASRSANVR